MPEDDYDEKQSYLEIFQRDRAIYEATPPRSFLTRSKLRKKLRYSYGDAVGKGNNISMPPTAWEARREDVLGFIADGWGRPFHRGWLFDWTVTLGIIATVAVAIYLIVFVGIFESHPKPLPPGVQQRGYTFIIPPDYATRANYKDIRANNLCQRLPQFDMAARSGDEAKARSGRDGSIIIECRLDD